MTLVSAINHLPSDYKKLVRSDFYGEGNQEKLLQHKVTVSNINAHFFGHLSQETLVQELSYCSLSVLPSLFEGFGLSAIETMALGIPTITSDFEASGLYILDGVNGNRFPTHDVSMLSDLIRWHIDNPNKSAELGLNGRNTSREMFNANNTYRKYLKLIGTTGD